MKQSKEMEELIIEAIDSCYDKNGEFSSAGAKANVERLISQNYISKAEVEEALKNVLQVSKTSDDYHIGIAYVIDDIIKLNQNKIL